jgi:soluble lytic murein transglycosylase-like protein
MNTTVLLAVRFYAGLRSTLALVGLAAVAALITLAVQREVVVRHLPALGAALTTLSDGLFDRGSTVTAGPIHVSAVESAVEREQRAVTEFISRRYRVAEHAVAGFVTAAYRAGGENSVDPLLVLAVAAVESRYNPVAESVMGAKGLMQVIPKFHLEKLMDHGGELALLDPVVNIAVGTQILREYQRRFGDVETALQAYGGAFDEPTSQYANKVLAEKARLEVFRQKARKQQSV